MSNVGVLQTFNKFKIGKLDLRTPKDDTSLAHLHINYYLKAIHITILRGGVQSVFQASINNAHFSYEKKIAFTSSKNNASIILYITVIDKIFSNYVELFFSDQTLKYVLMNVIIFT